MTQAERADRIVSTQRLELELALTNHRLGELRTAMRLAAGDTDLANKTQRLVAKKGRIEHELAAPNKLSALQPIPVLR